MNKHKHLSDDERYDIQHGLSERMSFKQIALKIGRDCTTIAKEVRLHRTFKQTGSFGNPFNDCNFRFGCSENALCPDKRCRTKQCQRCTYIQCRKLCERYEKQICPKRDKPPYVCNGCADRNKCTLEKAVYSATSAHKEYIQVLSESRSGICADENELQRLDALFSDLIVNNGQSIHHICVTSPDCVMWSEPTIFKYIGMGLIRAKNIDLPRKVRFRPRKSKHDSFLVNKSCRIGRTYEDYKKFIADNPDSMVVEMDTVHGRIGGKCLLTLHFVNAHFMLAYLLPACTANAVREVFAHLLSILGTELYSVLFSLILTDNGSEFSDPLAIEVNGDGECLSTVFYCDPRQSQQKGAAEVNHEMIRRVIPKGTSMDDLSQEDISTMMNHINSYARASLNDRSPYHMFELMFGADTLKKLDAEFVPYDKITLRPSLLK